MSSCVRLCHRGAYRSSNHIFFVIGLRLPSNGGVSKPKPPPPCDWPSAAVKGGAHLTTCVWPSAPAKGGRIAAQTKSSLWLAFGPREGGAYRRSNYIILVIRFRPPSNGVRILTKLFLFSARATSFLEAPGPRRGGCIETQNIAFLISNLLKCLEVARRTTSALKRFRSRRCSLVLSLKTKWFKSKLELVCSMWSSQQKIALKGLILLETWVEGPLTRIWVRLSLTK